MFRVLLNKQVSGWEENANSVTRGTALMLKLETRDPSIDSAVEAIEAWEEVFYFFFLLCNNTLTQNIKCKQQSACTFVLLLCLYFFFSLFFWQVSAILREKVKTKKNKTKNNIMKNTAIFGLLFGKFR